MTPGRRLLSNVASLGVFKALADVTVLVMFVFLARHFGRDGLGEYSFAMAFTGFLAMAANFGFENYAVREVARDPSREGKYFGTFIILGLLLCPLLIGSIALLARIAGFDTLRFSVVLAIGAYQVLYFFGFIVLGRFRAHNEMKTVGLLELALRLAILAGTVGVSLAGASLPAVAAVMPAMTAIYLLVAACLLARSHAKLRWRIDWSFLRGAWGEIWPFGLALLLHASYMKIDVLMIGLIRDETEVGIYSAAFRPVFGFLALAGFCCNTTYPVFSRLFVESRAEFQRAVTRFAQFLMVLSSGLALGIVCLAEPVMRVLYGGDFADSVPVFRVFALLAVISTLNSFMDPVLGAADRQRVRMRLLPGSIVLNVALNLVLVPRHGYWGALVATIISEGLLLSALYYALASRGQGFRLAVNGLRPTLSAVAGGGVWFVGRGLLGDVPATMIAFVVYGGLVVLLGCVSVQDIALLWRLRPGRRGRPTDHNAPAPTPTNSPT